MSTGIVFPGMGPSGYAELGQFIATDPGARRLRRLADEVLGYPLMDHYRTADPGYSEYAQVAFLITCLALAERAAGAADGEPKVCAGPSFGGKVALAYTGVLSFQATVSLVARLARCEQEYFREHHQDVLTQSVARTPQPRLREILDDMTGRQEWHDVSCHIDEDFFMVSMREGSLERFLGAVRAAGGLPLYAMRPPMHSSAFGRLRRMVEEEVLKDFRFADPRIPLVTDQDGSSAVTADRVRTTLLDGITRPVDWPAVVRSMRSLGVTRIVVSGPDSLFGRVRCTTGNFEVVPLSPRTAGRPRPQAAPRALE